ncbi:hypothetical protein GJAV_G00095620 [Gymnothorax javanicus]|nr:hypothetical protein GJAV_G00095620 [Gymnothorax javanicus]
MFRTVHALAKKGRPMADFEWICDLDEMKELPVGETYRNKNSFAALELSPIMPTRVGGTRWLAHLLRAIDHFLRGYPPIMPHLNQITSPDVQGVSAVQQCKAKCFSAAAKEAVVLRFSGFLHDTLRHLSRVSETLQKSDISIADAHSCLSSTHALLESYKTRAGPMTKATQDEVFKGVSLTSGRAMPRGQEGEDRVLISCQEQLLDRLIESIRDRFKDRSSDVLWQQSWSISGTGHSQEWVKQILVMHKLMCSLTTSPMFYRLLNTSPMSGPCSKPDFTLSPSC